MQRVKAHELRQKEEKSLVEELTKFRVSHIPHITSFPQKELAQLRVSKVSAAPQVKLARIRVRLYLCLISNFSTPEKPSPRFSL